MTTMMMMMMMMMFVHDDHPSTSLTNLVTLMAVAQPSFCYNLPTNKYNGVKTHGQDFLSCVIQMTSTSEAKICLLILLHYLFIYFY
jgi:hypothetical protein